MYDYCNEIETIMDNINPNSLLATHPEVAKEWNFEKNKNLAPNDVTKGMRKKVWWKCEKGPDHEWEAMIYSKSSGGSKCPYCNGKKVSITNRLDILCPVVAQEWNYDKNNLGPDEYTCGSNKKVWWKCSKGHEWLSTIANRTNKDTQRGCPYCARKKPSEINRLDIHGSKKVLKEWHPKNEGNPCDYSIGSHKKVWWKCSEGHEWSARISDRTLKGGGCPYCTRQRPSEINRLDLHASQSILDEWHPKNEKSIKEYSYGTMKKVWWKCSKNHEWEASIWNRVGLKANCPICNESKGEIVIRDWLINRGIRYEPQAFLNPFKKWQYDFYLPEHNIAVEYDGIQHFEVIPFFYKRQSDFEERQKIDLAKTKYCAFHGISLIRINYRYFDEIEDRMEKAINYRKSDKEVLYYFTGIEYDDHEKVFNENLRPL